MISMSFNQTYTLKIMKKFTTHVKVIATKSMTRVMVMFGLLFFATQVANSQDKSYQEFLEQPEFSILKEVLDGQDSDKKSVRTSGYTFFAPTNDAFRALGEEKLKYLYANPKEFANILRYHFVDSKIYAADLTDGQIIHMREGTDAFISLFDSKAYINQAEIIKTDIETYYGVIHVIDAVLTQPKSIVDIVVNSPRHESLEAAVVAAELAGALSAEGDFTLFAPTDDAFAALGSETIDALFGDPTGDLASILKYHAVGARALSGDLSDGDMFTTLEGSDIEVTINEEGIFINDAKVVFADYQAPNGVVHVIDAVLTPPVPSNTVVDVIVNSEIHESLEAAVIAAELDGALSGEGPFTVFAPTDDAFAALGSETIDALFADPTGDLASILQYHVVSGEVMAGDLSDRQVIEMLEGTNTYISLYKGKAYINQAEITVTDIEADNGVVHVIDAVLTQPESVLDLIAINPRLTRLLDAIYAAGLEDFFSSVQYYTIFAPTDEAWEEFLEILSESDEKSTVNYSELLENHTLNFETYLSDMTDGNVMESMAGFPLHVTVNENGVHLNDAKIIQSDLIAPNGVIHMVDKVITEQGGSDALSATDQMAVFGNTNIYPNPAQNRTSVSFELSEKSGIQIEVIDLAGKKVKSVNYDVRPEGYQVIDLEISDLDAGMYIINLMKGDSVLSKKLRVQ